MTRTNSDPSVDLVEQILADLHSAAGALRCAASARLVKSGVSMTHLHVLWMLRHHGDMPMHRIAELLDVSVSNATGIVDRMEERSLVERIRVPDDRRLVVVRPAPDGLAALEELEAFRQDRLRTVLGRLDETQLRRLSATLEDLRGALAPEAPAGGDDVRTHHHH